MQDKPKLERYRRHAILCAGKKCEPAQDRALMQYLKKRLTEEGLDTGEDMVRANRAGCLGVCEQGPIMVVYPEGVWYCRLNEANIDRIIEMHFKGGKAVSELVFHEAPVCRTPA
ncbi:MAG TPA: NAD(P)H-dependent oxidoreductase subunit E [Mariprofundaceae bacterium]|nr:NAD(P)H-dependent oxidoreductase subunit E [Mariprofundaceae bacterium]